MFKVILKHQDGTVFWQCFFKSLDEANKWIAEEKTRKYWDKANIVEVTDERPAPKTPEEKQIEQDKDIAKEAMRSRLKSSIAIIEADKVLSDELKQVLKDLVLSQF